MRVKASSFIIFWFVVFLGVIVFIAASFSDPPAETKEVIELQMLAAEEYPMEVDLLTWCIDNGIGYQDMENAFAEVGIGEMAEVSATITAHDSDYDFELTNTSGGKYYMTIDKYGEVKMLRNALGSRVYERVYP